MIHNLQLLQAHYLQQQLNCDIAAPAAVTTVEHSNSLVDALMTVSHTDATAGTCPTVITRTYTVTDACTNSVNIIHTITVDDTQAPVVTGTLSVTNVEGCNAGAAPAAATTVGALEALAGSITITDACTPDASLTVSHSDAIAGTCPTVITRTYTVTDACLNSVNIIHTINVDDTQAPVVTGSLSVTNVEGCNAGAAPAAATTVAALEALAGGITITDACIPDASLTVTHTNTSAGTCPIVITRTYTVTDACLNSVNIIHTINVDDTQAPLVTGSLNPTTVEGCDISAAPAAVTTVAALEALAGSITITDACTPDASLTVSHTDAEAGLCPTVITRTYTITDACTNSVNIIHTINVDDTQAPTWTTAVNFLDRTVQCSDAAGIAAAQALFPVATDNCDADVTNIVKTAGAFVAGSCPEAGTYTNTWTVTDACGNVSAAYSQVITIIDTQAPTWTTAVSFLNRTVQCSDAAGIAAAQALFPAATDNCDTDVTNIVKTAGAFVAGYMPRGRYLYQ